MNQFRVILVDPRFAANIGSTARVCTNFGVQDFYGVSKATSRWHWHEAEKIAVSPSDKLLQSFQVKETLIEAVSECDLAIAFTRRTGEERLPDLTPSQLRSLFEHHSPRKVALVFGNEETGLTDSEIHQCTHLCRIPTSDEMPSMNLSHAVAVVLSHLFEDYGSNTTYWNTGPQKRAPLSELHGLNEHFRELLISAGLTQAGNPDRLQRRLWRIFQKVSLSSRDIKIFRGILSKSLQKMRKN